MDLVKIILDTNFFFVPFDFNVNIFREFDRIIQTSYEVVTFPAIIDELKNLEKKRSSIKWKKRIQLAMKIVEKCKVIKKIPDTEEKIDVFILRIAKENNWIVATNDKELKKKLRQNRINVIYLRQKSHLVLEGSLF
ncbi:MAG: type II toxin-antitoxin system VapC family toxin [Candidatus Helarchaeota archaeon]